MKKWFAGLAAAIIAGVVVYWATVGWPGNRQGISTPTLTETPANTSPGVRAVIGEYYTDNDKWRKVVVGALGGDRLRIEEPSGPYPWSGEAQLDGGQLSGEAVLRKSSVRMTIEGVVRGDSTIQITYRFPAEPGRADLHVWYPVRSP